jgi:hypothetical protein
VCRAPFGTRVSSFCHPKISLPDPLAASQYVIEVNSEGLSEAGTSSSGIGFASNNLRHGTANQRATCVAFCLRALSVEMPVFAYIWRYNLEMNRNANRPRSVGTHFDRAQIFRRL